MFRNRTLSNTSSACASLIPLAIASSLAPPASISPSNTDDVPPAVSDANIAPPKRPEMPSAVAPAVPATPPIMLSITADSINGMVLTTPYQNAGSRTARGFGIFVPGKKVGSSLLRTGAIFCSALALGPKSAVRPNLFKAPSAIASTSPHPAEWCNTHSGNRSCTSCTFSSSVSSLKFAGKPNFSGYAIGKA